MSLVTRIATRMLGLPPAVAPKLEYQLDLEVPMPDGVVLLANRVAPRGGEDLPILLLRTPYTHRGRKPDLTSRLLAERGYQVVVQNCRGTFGSGGEFRPLRDEREDGLATLRWLATQAWFSGAVGMVGNSYYAYVQLACGPGAPEHLRALVPMMGASRIYNIKRGDPFRFNVALTWVYQQYGARLVDKSAFARALVMARRSRATRRGFAHLPVGEADRASVGRTVPYYQDIIRNERPDDEFWAAMDHSERVKDIEAPVHFVGSWHDFFLADELADYQALREAGRNPYLTICAGGHASVSAAAEGLRQSLVWYDAHLRGNRASLPGSPVRIRVTGTDTWTDLDSWPPPSTPANWYLHPGGRLSRQAPHSPGVEPSRYRYDPADPTPRVGGRVVFDGGPKDNRKLEARPDVLTFTTEPMTRDATVIGSVTARLHVRSSLERTDFFARLCDVTPQGKSINLCDGIIRLTPDSPRDGDGVHHVTIDLSVTGHCFRTGHRIRLQVSSGAHPMHARNLGTGEPLATGTRMLAADQQVLHDSTHLSTVVLPVVG